MNHLLLLPRPPGLSKGQIRLRIACDPFGFTVFVAAILAALLFKALIIVVLVLAGLLTLAVCSPWVRPLRCHAERRAFSGRLRRLELRRNRREAGLLSALEPELVNRYGALKEHMREVPQGESLEARAGRCDALHHRLDALLLAYLRLLVAHAAHERFLDSADAPDLREQIEMIGAEIGGAPSKLKAVKRARLEILRRRLRRHGEVCEQREVISTRLCMVEDIVSLMRESTLRSPDTSFLEDELDDLLIEVEAAEEAVKSMDISHEGELDRFEKLIAS